MTKNRQNRDSRDIIPRMIRQEYWIDVLGGILPGTLVIISYIFIFTPVVFLCGDIINALDGRTSSKGMFCRLTELLTSIQQTPNILWLTAALILFFISYIVGHIFYRKDPQKPNRLSLKRLIVKEAKQLAKQTKKKNINYKGYLDFLSSPNDSSISKEDKKLYEKLREIIKKEYACTSEKDCEFPYPYFEEYLANRGLKHLEQFITWKENKNYRTKNFINILKMRIRFFFPDQCGTIIRNEAHVRLACSVWYAGRVVSFGAISSLLLLIITCSFAAFYNRNDFISILLLYRVSFFIVLLIIIFFTIVGEISRRHIELFLHYQRQREIVHVLETAWAAFCMDPSGKELPMKPPFNIECNKEPKGKGKS